LTNPLCLSLKLLATAQSLLLSADGLIALSHLPLNPKPHPLWLLRRGDERLGALRLQGRVGDDDLKGMCASVGRSLLSEAYVHRVWFIVLQEESMLWKILHVRTFAIDPFQQFGLKLRGRSVCVTCKWTWRECNGKQTGCRACL
jgi:hypothetical protein